MSKILLAFCLALAAGLLALTDAPPVSAQDCERVISGNNQSPCKLTDFFDEQEPPRFIIERLIDARGDYYCKPAFVFTTTTPSTEDIVGDTGGLGSESNPAQVHISKSRESLRIDSRDYRKPGLAYSDAHYLTSQSDFQVAPNEIRIRWGRPLGLKHPVPIGPRGDEKEGQDLADYYLLANVYMHGGYWLRSDIFPAPSELNDYRLLMNQCLAGIAQQLEHKAALETARQQAEVDRVAAENAVQEAENQAEIGAIELQSAQDALSAQEALNAALLAETILAIKREDAIRAAWQQVMLVRMAGLEQRTALWNGAVERWAEEDLQFSTAMQARIQEVERLQALTAALEQSMADQRQLLVAQLEDLEQAEREAQENRTPETEPASSSETGG